MKKLNSGTSPPGQHQFFQISHANDSPQLFHYSCRFLRWSHYLIYTITNTTEHNNNQHSVVEDEGFASSSSVEENRTADIIRRKRAQKQLKSQQPSSADANAQQPTGTLSVMTFFAEHPPSATTSLRWEQRLWVGTYFWVLWKTLQGGEKTLRFSGPVLIGNNLISTCLPSFVYVVLTMRGAVAWTLFILGGWALLVRRSSNADNHTGKMSSPAHSSSADPFDSETLSSPTTRKLKSSSVTETAAVAFGKMGLYGSGKSSVRYLFYIRRLSAMIYLMCID